MSDSAAEAFRWFVTDRYERLLRVAYLLTGDARRAEDLLQRALAKTWFAWNRLHLESADAYVRVVLTRTYISDRRRRWNGELPTASVPEGPAPDELTRVLDRDRLRRALATLPARMRSVLVLRYFEDLSEEQTAEALGCSVGTVKSQASRGLARLRATGGLRDGDSDGVREGRP
jgi:RNA polymerase sigma-70 factor (sigma-E family)